MSFIRAVFRLIAFFLATIILLIILAPCKFPLFPDSFYYMVKRTVIPVFGRVLASIVGMNITKSGQAPDAPFFLVSNHLSYLDIIPLWIHTGGTFIAKNEIKNWPFFGIAAKLAGILFIDRENKRDISRVNSLLDNAINEYQGIILFPEGTSTNGEEVLPFHAPLLQYPALEETPVSYASISYSTNDETKPASQYVCWWGDMTFFSHFFDLLKIKSFNARIVFGDKAVVNKNRKKLANILHQKVAANFVPTDN